MCACAGRATARETINRHSVRHRMKYKTRWGNQRRTNRTASKNNSRNGEMASRDTKIGSGPRLRQSAKAREPGIDRGGDIIMNELSNGTRNTILILGLIQGLLLLSAHVVAAHDILTASADLIWLVPWWAAGIGVLTALQLILTDTRDRRVWLFGLGLLGVLALTGGYAGYSAEPPTQVNVTRLVMPYILTTFIGWYVLLPFVQDSLKTGRLRPAYPVLFEFAWNNGITLLIAMIFTGIFWALLSLWAGLFEVIGIAFFGKFFSTSISVTR